MTGFYFIDDRPTPYSRSKLLSDYFVYVFRIYCNFLMSYKKNKCLIYLLDASYLDRVRFQLYQFLIFVRNQHNNQRPLSSQLQQATWSSTYQRGWLDVYHTNNGGNWWPLMIYHQLIQRYHHGIYIWLINIWASGRKRWYEYTFKFITVLVIIIFLFWNINNWLNFKIPINITYYF